MDINQTIQTLGWVCGAIIALGGAISVIGKWWKPVARMQDDIKELKENDEQTREGVGVICRCILALMDCVAKDNPEGVKHARKEMQDYLTKL